MYFGFCISFNPSSPKRINLVFFHRIHYWHISGREPAVVPEQLAPGTEWWGMPYKEDNPNVVGPVELSHGAWSQVPLLG